MKPHDVGSPSLERAAPLVLVSVNVVDAADATETFGHRLIARSTTSAGIRRRAQPETKLRRRSWSRQSGRGCPPLASTMNLSSRPLALLNPLTGASPVVVNTKLERLRRGIVARMASAGSERATRCSVPFFALAPGIVQIPVRRSNSGHRACATSRSSLPRQNQDLKQGPEGVAELLRGLPNEHELVVPEPAIAAKGAGLDGVLDAPGGIIRPKLRFDRIREELRAPRAEAARRNGPAAIDNGFDTFHDVCRRDALDRSPAPIGEGVLLEDSAHLVGRSSPLPLLRGDEAVQYSLEVSGVTEKGC